jgi:hypothetical protein
MVTLAVLVVFTAMLIACWASASRQEPKARPIRVHRDEQSLHHRRNLPGPGAD